ncbi:MAG: hypothetical protein LBP62_07480 [Clostridiales bacterium]|jgi:hypothetical protein|nr:hypothetical protein [Clostridiales bacterium]
MKKPNVLWLTGIIFASVFMLIAVVFAVLHLVEKLEQYRFPAYLFLCAGALSVIFLSLFKPVKKSK